ncbi:MAG: DUF2298 domain-containing protein [Chloroflexi bacterium]|nr:DUF2298 domain-containing protein [Chloroflexota bacterium]
MTRREACAGARRAGPIDQALWLLALVAFAVLGVPWARLAFGRLTTRGLALAAPVGFFLFHYVAWLGLFTGWFRNGQLYAWAALAVFAAVTVVLAWLMEADLRELWPRRRVWVWGVAALLVTYGVGVGMRWLNPEIAGTEKPMDLALLSATMRSTAFPPLDPWFAGGTINYYYLGYSMGGALAHLAGATPAVAYNLYLATLLALLVVGVGSAAYDLAAMLGAGPRRALRAAIGSVLVGVVAGNLAITRAVVTEEFRGQTGFWPGIGWNASRVIERQPVDGVADKTINEFPAFSFILGDLHPHVMALPFTVVAAGLALQGVAAWWRPGAVRGWTPWAGTLLAGLVVGGLYGLNAWDLPTYLVLVIGAALLAHLAGPGARAWGRLLAHAALMVVAAAVAWLPYSLNVTLLSEGLGVVPTRTLALHFLQVFGLLGLLAVGGLVALLADGSRSTRAWLGASLVVAALAVLVTGGEIVGVLLVVLALAAAVMGRRQTALGPFAMGLLIAAAVGLMLVVELVHVDDFFGPPYVRMNTVFKVHYQAWALLAIAAGPALLVTWRKLSDAGGAGWSVVRAGYASVVAVLLVLALSYSAVALRDKAADSEVSGTIDGLALAEHLHADDLAAARWLARNAGDAAVVLEAPGTPYSEMSRIATWSGVPTVIGWTQHEQLWRGSIPDIGERAEDVDRIYATSDAAEAVQLMRRYGVTHVVFGRIERARYDAEAASRLRAYLEPVAQFGGTMIFAGPAAP